MTKSTLILFDFADSHSAWQIIDDVVMGGVSGSRFHVEPAGLGVFSGDVSLDRGGGFASVRSLPHRFDLSAYEGIEVRLRGDGKRYRVRLTTDGRFDGVAYQFAFDTEPEAWTTIRFPFAGFQPRFRGQPVPGAPPLDRASIQTVGFLIADRQAGPFRLEIDWIRAYHLKA